MSIEPAANPEVADSLAAARRRRDLVELWVGYALILVVIWTPRPWQRTFYFVAATFVVAATWLSFPGWKAMGFGIVNLARSMWLVAVALLAAAVAMDVAGRMHTLHSPGGFTMFFDRYAGYMIFAIVQQALLQSYFLLHFLRLTRRPQTAALAAAAIFSLAHLPNPILTVCTFVWGLAACLFFLRYRNLYSLSIAHAILGITLAICVPGPVIRNMRVGLGYLTYHAPRADHGLDHRNH
jgi:membrane protease YdiL (CAAX protease family)